MLKQLMLEYMLKNPLPYSVDGFTVGSQEGYEVYLNSLSDEKFLDWYDETRDTDKFRNFC